jgi:hypothetical protein
MRRQVAEVAVMRLSTAGLWAVLHALCSACASTTPPPAVEAREGDSTASEAGSKPATRTPLWPGPTARR